MRLQCLLRGVKGLVEDPIEVLEVLKHRMRSETWRSGHC